jgi:hypothetical protein
LEEPTVTDINCMSIVKRCFRFMELEIKTGNFLNLRYTGTCKIIHTVNWLPQHEKRAKIDLTCPNYLFPSSRRQCRRKDRELWWTRTSTRLWVIEEPIPSCPKSFSPVANTRPLSEENSTLKSHAAVLSAIYGIFLHGHCNILMYKRKHKGVYGWERGCERRRRRGRRGGRRGALRRRGTPWGSTAIPTPPAPAARSPRFPIAPPPAVVPARPNSWPPPCPTRPIAASASATASA